MIDFSDFSWTYKSQKEPTLRHIDLHVEAGEKLLVVGPSGSGKSTLGNCINGLIPHAMNGTIQGSLKVCSMETKDTDIYDLNKKVGTVLQDTDGQFVGITVAEDIAFSLENQCVPKPRMLSLVMDMATIVDMQQFLSQSPGDLSGGQKQRVSLAGVLVDDVEVLLFDEPLANLDPATGKLAIDLIDKLHVQTGKTIVIIEHRLEDVLYRPVDRIVLMDNGSICMDTTPAQLLASGLLRSKGIREPLYLSAIGLAGCKIAPTPDITSVESLDAAPYAAQVCSWFHAHGWKEPQATGKEQLRLEHVSYSYDGIRNALSDISFSVRKGEMLSVLGKNGAGKSTLAQLLMGILRPDTGKLFIDGREASADSITQRSSKIGYVMQDPNNMISHNLIFDEIAFGLRLKGVDEQEVRRRVLDVLALCGLERHQKWPISALSYGQKKRVTIASILVMDPEVLILDEPTAGQDYERYSALMTFLRSINRRLGITVLFVTHDMHLALEYTPRAIVLTDGKLLRDGAVSEIFGDEQLMLQANLKQTSLYALAGKCGIAANDVPAFIRTFIHEEQRLKDIGLAHARADGTMDSVPKAQLDASASDLRHADHEAETHHPEQDIPVQEASGSGDETFGIDAPKGRKFGFGLSYIDTGSWIHRLNGVAKFLFFIGWMVLCLTTFDIRVLGFALVISLVAMFSSRVPFRKYRPLLVAMLAIIGMNSLFIFLFSPGQGTIYMGSRTVLLGNPSARYALTAETLWYLLVVCLKYFTIFPVALVFVFCTQPSEFASSLNRIGLSYKVSYAVSLSLRYIPEISDDFTHIMHAQMARGVDISKKVPLRQRMRNVAKLLAPLVLSSLDRIEVITNAMVLRGFGRLKRRTWYSSEPLRATDLLVIVFVCATLALSLTMRFGFGTMFWYPF